MGILPLFLQVNPWVFFQNFEPDSDKVVKPFAVLSIFFP
ncbi:uncharacterized protein METZ01_LOCUS219766, partial [marine metagenome]